MNKIKVFQKFLNTFETEEMKMYCTDMIDISYDYLYKIPASTSYKYHNATQCQAGGQMYHVLMACEIMNYILGLEYIQEKWPKCKQRDCFRAAILFHDMAKCGSDGTFTLHDHPLLVKDWIMDNKVEHDIDNNLKLYIARLCASHSGQWTTSPKYKGITLPKPENDEQFLIHLCDYLGSRSNLDMIYSEEESEAIRSCQDPIDVNDYKMPFGKHKGVSLKEVPKDYLKWLYSTDVKEPLKSLIPQVLEV